MMTIVIRMMAVMKAIIVAFSALPTLPNSTIEMYIRRKKNDDDHNDDDQGDDDDHEDDGRMMTVIITIIVASSALPMLPMTMRMMIRMMTVTIRVMTVMIIIIVASSASPMLPNATIDIEIRNQKESRKG